MMKAYTDIEQSKKLAKILPLKSADMYYFCGDKDDICFGSGVYEEIADWNSNGTPKPADIPCWSFVALFNVLPTSINNYIPTLRVVNGSYCCAYSSKENYGDWLWFYANNSIDACYEMIIKLHELKML